MLLFSDLLIKEGLRKKMERIMVTYRLYLRVAWRDFKWEEIKKRETHVAYLLNVCMCNGWSFPHMPITQRCPDSPFLLFIILYVY